MNKTDLISKMSDRSGISKSHCTKVLDSFMEAVESALKSGDDVRLVGFGTFSVSKRAAMKGRNPRTGQEIKIAASKRPKFKPGKNLIDALN
jgi:DNA-binding protein HU-beta